MSSPRKPISKLVPRVDKMDLSPTTLTPSSFHSSGSRWCIQKRLASEACELDDVATLISSKNMIEVK